MKKIILFNEKEKEAYFLEQERIVPAGCGKVMLPRWKDIVYQVDSDLFLRGKDNSFRRLGANGRMFCFAENMPQNPQNSQVFMKDDKAYFADRTGMTEISPKNAALWNKLYASAKEEISADNAFALENDRRIRVFVVDKENSRAVAFPVVKSCSGNSFVYRGRAYVVCNRRIERVPFRLYAAGKNCLLLGVEKDVYGMEKDVYVFTAEGFSFLGNSPCFLEENRLITVHSDQSVKCYQLCDGKLRLLCSYPEANAEAEIQGRYMVVYYFKDENHSRANVLRRRVFRTGETGLFYEIWSPEKM